MASGNEPTMPTTARIRVSGRPPQQIGRRRRAGRRRRPTSARRRRRARRATSASEPWLARTADEQLTAISADEQQRPPATAAMLLEGIEAEQDEAVLLGDQRPAGAVGGAAERRVAAASRPRRETPSEMSGGTPARAARAQTSVSTVLKALENRFSAPSARAVDRCRRRRRHVRRLEAPRRARYLVRALERRRRAASRRVDHRQRPPRAIRRLYQFMNAEIAG